jgi:hypothetical protein
MFLFSPSCKLLSNFLKKSHHKIVLLKLFTYPTCKNCFNDQACWFECEAFPTLAYKYPGADEDFKYITGYRYHLEDNHTHSFKK